MERCRIFRRANAEPHDVIVVDRKHVSARELADAVFTLEMIRPQYGDVPSSDGTFRVGKTRSGHGRADEAKKWMEFLKTDQPTYSAGLWIRPKYLIVASSLEQALTGRIGSHRH